VSPSLSKPRALPSGPVQAPTLFETIGFVESIRGTVRSIFLPGREMPVPVRIRPGVRDGQLVRAQVDGTEPFPGHLAMDDIHLVVHVIPDPRFRREGHDLHTDVAISIGEAIYGAQIEVPTPEGPRRAKVPPGVESGQHLRFRGLGVSASDGVPAGHLYVTLRIQLPDLDPGDDEARAAVALLESRYKARPRSV